MRQIRILKFETNSNDRNTKFKTKEERRTIGGIGCMVYFFAELYSIFLKVQERPILDFRQKAKI